MRSARFRNSALTSPQTPFGTGSLPDAHRRTVRSETPRARDKSVCQREP